MSAVRSLLSQVTSIARSTAEKGKSWGPTAAAWGGSLGLVGLFLTDWKVITGKIPYIKEKYNHEIPR